ncbi:MAG: hypothetical protein WC701_05195 [Kiritimatiellales bacterium]
MPPHSIFKDHGWCTDATADTVCCDIVEKVAYLTDSTNGREAGTTVTAGERSNRQFCPDTAQHLRRLLSGRLTGTALRGGQGVDMFSLM